MGFGGEDAARAAGELVALGRKLKRHLSNYRNRYIYADLSLFVPFHGQRERGEDIPTAVLYISCFV